MVVLCPTDFDDGDSNLNHRKESILVDSKVNVAYTYVASRFTGRARESAG